MAEQGIGVYFSDLSRTMMPMQRDNDLVLATLNGDKQAFETLYSEYVQRLYKYVYYRTHDRDIAEDIVSQTFLNAYDKLSSYDSSRGEFSAWLYRIARNLLVDFWRQRHPHDSVDDVWDLAADDDPVADADAAVRLQQVRPLLAALKPQQREVLLLRLWHGLSFAEIAQITDSTEAACKMSYHRSLTSLKSALLFLLLVPLSFLFS